MSFPFHSSILVLIVLCYKCWGKKKLFHKSGGHSVLTSVNIFMFWLFYLLLHIIANGGFYTVALNSRSRGYLVTYSRRVYQPVPGIADTNLYSQKAKEREGRGEAGRQQRCGNNLTAVSEEHREASVTARQLPPPTGNSTGYIGERVPMPLLVCTNS